MKLSLLLFFICFSAGIISGQTRTVRGTVTEENGDPIIGCYVMVKGTSIGTTTDFDGNFNLNVPNDTQTLTFSSVGMEAKELPVQDVMNVKLSVDSQQLEEVVITGIGRMDKRLFTGAADKIDASTARLDGIADVSRGLEGRSAGVSVQNVSGTFGTAPKIRVRGATSIYGSSKPLWVVDGVIVESIVEVSADDLSSGDAQTLISSAIAGLNSEDVESFQILKDGSATSIYGARAMAGVIVITTKKGTAGMSSINYTGEFTYRLKPSYNEFNIMNSQDQMSVYKEMKDKGWLNFAETYRASESGVYGNMYNLISAYNPATGFGLPNTPEAMNGYLRAAEMRNTDWFDHLFNSNVMQNHSISISSGNEKATYYSSISAMYDPGWTLQSEVQRYTGNFNVNYNILKDLSINLISMGAYRNQKAPGTLGQSVDVVNGQVKRDFDINPYSYAMNSSRALDPNTFYTSNYAPLNILNELDNNYMDIDVIDLKFQGELKWKIVKGLDVAGLAALNYKRSAQEHHTKDNSNQSLAYRSGVIGGPGGEDATTRDANRLLYTDPDVPYSLPITVLPEGGIYQRTDWRMQSLDLRGTLTWIKDFNDDHIINFFGGSEVRTMTRKNTWFTGWGLQYEMGEIPFYPYQYFKKGLEGGNNYYSINSTTERMVAFFGSGTYSYKGIYSLNLTGRYEGTNKMGRSREARWLPTWNIGLAWNVHEENFFESMSDIFSHLSLKSSYSLTGTPVADFVSNSRVIIKSYVPWRPFTGVQESGLRIEDLENSDLTYEKKYEFNIGAEMGFLKNKINFAVDVYWRDNFDLIGIVNTQGVGGSTMKYANFADMKGQGYDLTLTTKNIEIENFSWTTNFIFGHSTTKITRLESIARAIDYISGVGDALVGYPNRGLFSIPFMGLDKHGVPTFLREDGTVSSFEDPTISFQSRDNLDYLKYEGPTDPPYNGSLGNIFKYKNFRLNVFMTYSFGNVVRLNPVFNYRYSDLSSMTREFKNRWMMPGDENYTDIPVIISSRQAHTNRDISQTYNAYNFSDVRVAKGDFIRMKEISLTYDFPKGLINNISNLSLKAQATNLFLIYADKKLNGQDPEFFQAGGVSAPVPKQFTFTLRASF